MVLIVIYLFVNCIQIKLCQTFLRESIFLRKTKQIMKTIATRTSLPGKKTNNHCQLAQKVLELYQ